MINLTENQIIEKLKNIEALVLDQDGTLYLEHKSFPWTLDFLHGLDERGIRYLFLSNNSSKSCKEHINKLAEIGISAKPEQILSSSESTIEYLKSLEDSKNIYLLATPNVEEDFKNAGFNIDANKPNYVVLAYDLTFTFDKLNKAARYVRNGVTFIATHADNNWMIAPNDYKPDVGALAAAITASTKVKPKFIGKPNIETINSFLRRLDVTKDKVAIMGDRLDTDIRMGNENKILTFLVLSGKTKIEELKTSKYQPSFILEKSIDILKYI